MIECIAYYYRWINLYKLKLFFQKIYDWCYFVPFRSIRAGHRQIYLALRILLIEPPSICMSILFHQGILVRECEHQQEKESWNLYMIIYWIWIHIEWIGILIGTNEFELIRKNAIQWPNSTSDIHIQIYVGTDKQSHVKLPHAQTHPRQLFPFQLTLPHNKLWLHASTIHIFRINLFINTVHSRITGAA